MLFLLELTMLTCFRLVPFGFLIFSLNYDGMVKSNKRMNNQTELKLSHVLKNGNDKETSFDSSVAINVYNSRPKSQN